MSTNRSSLRVYMHRDTRAEEEEEEERAEGRTSRKSMKRLGNLSHAGSPRKTDPNVQKIWKKKSGTGREV